MTLRTPLAAAAAAALLCQACVKEVSNEERLERESAQVEPTKTPDAEELARNRCEEVNQGLVVARDDKRSEEDRLAAYTDIYGKLKERAEMFEQAMKRNPDLAYQQGSQELLAARDLCIQSTADVKVELQTMITEIMQLLVVDDVRSGTPVKVARLNYDAVRSAIDRLELDDRDSLFQKLANAERQVGKKK